MKRLLLISAVLFAQCQEYCVPLFAQSAPHVMIYNQQPATKCWDTVSGTEIACTGAAVSTEQALVEFRPYNNDGEESDYQSTGTFAGGTELLVFNDEKVYEYAVPYSGPGPGAVRTGPPTVVAITDRNTWIATHLSQVADAAHQGPLPLHESSVIWSHTAGRWLIIIHSCYASDISGSQKCNTAPAESGGSTTGTWPIVAFSTSGDSTKTNAGCPSNCGWKTLKLTALGAPGTGIFTPRGDFTPRANCEPNACYVWMQDVTSVAPALGSSNDVMWAFGSHLFSQMGDASQGSGVLPAPDAVFSQATTPFPYRMFPARNFNTTTADYFVSSESLALGGLAQASRYKSQITVAQITWSANTPSMTVVSSAQVNSNWVNNQNSTSWYLAGAAGGGWLSTNLLTPGNRAVTTGYNYLANAAAASEQAGSGHVGPSIQIGNHLYVTAPQGSVSTGSSAGSQLPSGAWFYDVDVSAWPTVTVNQLGTLGTNVAGSLQLSGCNTQADKYGNVYSLCLAGSPDTELSPVAFYTTPADGYTTINGPFVLYGNLQRSTISGNGTTTYTLTTAPAYTGVVVRSASAFSGTLSITDQSSNPVSCTPMGMPPPLTPITSTTIDGAWTCPTTGLTSLKVVASGFSGSTVVSFMENYAFSRWDNGPSGPVCQAHATGFTATNPTPEQSIWTVGTVSWANPYFVWYTPIAGLTSNRCQIVPVDLQITAHFPDPLQANAGLTLAGGATTCSTSGGAFTPFTLSMKSLDTSVTDGSAEGRVFSSSNPAAVSIDPSTGVPTCNATGSADITASVMGVTSNIITVAASGAPTLNSISVTVDVTSIFIGGTVNVTPHCVWSDHTDTCPTGPWVWASSSPSVIASPGSVNFPAAIGLTIGSTTFTLTYNGVTSTASPAVTVSRPYYAPMHQ